MFHQLYRAMPALVFIAFLEVVLLLFLLSPDREYSENEKRYLAKLPEPSFSSILKGTTQKELETYTADQMPSRDLFVGLNAYWSLATGRNGGQDIYLCGGNTLVNAPAPLNREVFTGNLTRFDDFAAKMGLPADLIIVPSAGSLQGDALPLGHGAYHDETLLPLAQETLRHTRLLSVEDVLREGESTQPVFYRTDHHLTSWGNYLLYTVYQTAHGGQVLPRESYRVTTYPGFYGTTWSGSGYWLVEPDTLETWDAGASVSVTLEDGGKEPRTGQSLFFPEHRGELDKYPIFLDGNHALVTLQNPTGGEGSLLVIRDSYAHCFATLLAPHYETLYLLDYRYFRDSASAFLETHPVDRILYLYGIDSLLTDANSAWLN